MFCTLNSKMNRHKIDGVKYEAKLDPFRDILEFSIIKLQNSPQAFKKSSLFQNFPGPGK